MGLTNKTLAELLDYVGSDRLKLPEIQREFVWRRQSVKLLFDSLYRGLPIGQMLVWKPGEIVPQARTFSKRTDRSNIHNNDQFYGYLLDGQQRLTAIYRVLDGDEEYPLLLHLNPAEPHSDETFVWGGPRRYANPWYIRVSEALAPDFNSLQYLDALRAANDFKESFAQPVLDMLTRLRGLLNYSISVIEFESDSYEQATQLFIRFNSTGKKLNRTDLVLAELATQTEGLVSSRMGKVIGQWAPSFVFTRPFLVQCLAAIHTGRMNLSRPEQVFGDSKAKDIERTWERTVRALDMVIGFLTGTVKWDSDAWIPSFNGLIPLVYIVAVGGSFDATSRKLARKWLLLTGVHEHFSQGAYAELDRILRGLQKEPSVDKLWQLTRRNLPKLRKIDLQGSRQSGPLMSLFISMLREQDARDWISEEPLNGTVLGKRAKLHVHHFFPRALLAKHGYEFMWINSFANYTILCASTNLNIGMEEPATYLLRMSPCDEYLKAQCIPLEKKLLQVESYEKFIDKREELLTKRLNEFLEFA